MRVFILRKNVLKQHKKPGKILPVFFAFKLHLKKEKFLKNIVTNGVICLSNFEALCYNIHVKLYIYISRLIFCKNTLKNFILAKTKNKRHLGELCHLAY